MDIDGRDILFVRRSLEIKLQRSEVTAGRADNVHCGAEQFCKLLFESRKEKLTYFNRLDLKDCSYSGRDLLCKTS